MMCHGALQRVKCILYSTTSRADKSTEWDRQVSATPRRVVEVIEVNSTPRMRRSPLGFGNKAGGRAVGGLEICTGNSFYATTPAQGRGFVATRLS